MIKITRPTLLEDGSWPLFYFLTLTPDPRWGDWQDLSHEDNQWRAARRTVHVYDLDNEEYLGEWGFEHTEDLFKAIALGLLPKGEYLLGGAWQVDDRGTKGDFDAWILKSTTWAGFKRRYSRWDRKQREEDRGSGETAAREQGQPLGW